MVNYRKLLAASLAVSMVMGSSVVAFAEDQNASSSGSGETQYVAETDVFSVVFPTVAEDATTFDYLLDPSGLIAETGGDRYTGKAFDDGKSVYFLRSSKVDGTVGGTAGTANCDYTDKSDEIKVVNKSTEAVELVVSAKVVDVPEGMKMAESKTFSGTDTELYLGVVGTDGTTPDEKAITENGVELKASIEADEDAYEVKWDSTEGQYKKQLTANASADTYTGFKSYSFQLTGACNTATGTDWSGLTDAAPKVDLTWSVKDTITGPSFTLNADGLITVNNLTADRNYASIKVTDGEGNVWDINDELVEWNTENWNSTDGGSFTAQMSDRWISFIHSKGGKATAVLNLTDGSKIETSEITFNASSGS